MSTGLGVLRPPVVTLGLLVIYCCVPSQNHRSLRNVPLPQIVDQDLLSGQGSSSLPGNISMAEGLVIRNTRNTSKKIKKKLRPFETRKFDTSCSCGISAPPSQRIVNGVPAKQFQWPWMASIVSPATSTEAEFWYCGGSIISDRHILTAAHCIEKDGERLTIRLGDYDKTSDNGVEFLVNGTAKINKGYEFVGGGSDVAVVTLDKKIMFKQYKGKILPVCLAPKDGGLYENTPVTVAGWGTISSGGPQATKLMEVNLTTITNTQCKYNYKYKPKEIDDTMLCAVGVNKDSCQGDSGGPLVTYDNKRKRWIQIGVVSWGDGCAEKDYPGVYARVTQFGRWIVKRTAKQGGVFCTEG